MTALLDIDQLLDQMETGLRQALEQRGVQSPVLIGIRTGGIVHRHGRIFFRTRGGRRVTATDFPHGHADIVAASLHMDLS